MDDQAPTSAPKRSWPLALGLFVVTLAVIGSGCMRPDETTRTYDAAIIEIVQVLGENARARAELGVEILHRLNSKETDGKKLAIDAYRGQEVAFLGSGAPPGATKDLIAAGAVYLRLVTSEGEDFRPHSVGWAAVVDGKVLQVLPENKVVVIDVTPSGWHEIETW